MSVIGRRGVHEMTTPGGQAYAVLTLCRAWHLFTAGRQVSKRSAARHASAALPQWAALIDWAHDWWYAGGDDEEESRLVETTRFVDDVSSRILTR